jgi:hypothetical protein
MMEYQGIARRSLFTIALLGCLASAVRAQSSTQSAETPAITLSTVVVTGVLPGPALWKVSKGNHVMWILGLVSPVPKYMKWKFNDIDKRIGAAQAVLKPPGLEVGVNLTSWQSAALTSSVRHLRENPDGGRLQTVLPPALYDQWRIQKNRFLPNDSYVEHMRPIFAGRELYEAALGHKGLADQIFIEKTVYDAANRHAVKIVDTAYQLVLSHPTDAIDALRDVEMDDQRCLGQVLDAVEHDLAQATIRANAWATGDIDTLKTVLMQTREDDCFSAIDTSPFAKAAGMTDMQPRIDQSWIAHAEQALEANTQTVALLPMDQLFKPDGYLSVLRADGYTVQAPEE